MPEAKGRRWPRHLRKSGRHGYLTSADRTDFEVEIDIDGAESRQSVSMTSDSSMRPADRTTFAEEFPDEAFTFGDLLLQDESSEAESGNSSSVPHSVGGAERNPGALQHSSVQHLPLTPPTTSTQLPLPVSQVLGSVRVAQLVVGAASPAVEPKPISEKFQSHPFRPDTVVDGWSNDHVTVRGASLRGHFHRYNGAPRQDDFALHLMPDGRIVAIVADGVSAAPQSHFGASTVVNFAKKWLNTNLATQAAQTDWMELIRNSAWALALKAQEIFGLDGPDPARAEDELATTLTCAVIEVTGPGSLRAHIAGVGDSGAWLLREGEFTPVLGGKTTGEGGISSSAVTALPRVPNEITAVAVDFGPADVLLIGTDGVGDPLGNGQGGVGNLFRELFGADRLPSLVEFAHAVDFSRETFDDDRTLIAVIPRIKADPSSPASRSSSL